MINFVDRALIAVLTHIFVCVADAGRLGYWAIENVTISLHLCEKSDN